jgi:hypothetical protein
MADQRALAVGKVNGPFWPQPALPNKTSASTLAQKTLVRVMAISGVKGETRARPTMASNVLDTHCNDRS